MHFTLHQIRVFEAVVRHLSYTRAAEELHLSQPAVSIQIRQFENNIGLQLFEQLGKRIFLTDAGEETYRYTQLIGQTLAEFEEVINELKGVEGGRLRLAVASTVNYFATRLLASFSSLYPNVQVTLEVTNRESLLRLLDNNGTDIALMGQPPDGLDLESTPFMDNPLVVIASPSHPLASNYPVSLQDIQAQTFLLREAGSGTRIAMERFFAEHGVTLSGAMEMNSNEAIKQGVEAGLGLGVVSIHTVERELKHAQLVVLDVERFPIKRKWFLVHRRGKRLNAIAQTFKDYVLNFGE